MKNVIPVLVGVIVVLGAGYALEIKGDKLKENADTENQRLEDFTGRVDAQFKPLEGESTANKNVKKAEDNRCWEKPLIIEMEDFTFQTDRKGQLLVTYQDGSNENDFYDKCDIEKVSNVIGWGAREKFGIRTNGDFLKYSYSFLDKYKEHIKGMSPIVLNNGTKKYQLVGRQYFLLPTQENRTFDDEPVLIECHIPERDQTIYPTTRCFSWSKRKNNFYFDYKFLRKNYQENEFLNLDIEKNKMFLDSVIQQR